MSDSLDPDLARALQQPARSVRADPALVDAVRAAGAPAQSRLLALTSDADTPEDRYAAAAVLAAAFHDRGPLDQAARGYGSTPPLELLALADVPALRPVLRGALSSPIRTGLLEWATTADPSRPPLELAIAARDLGVSDAAVLRSVADRADRVAQQGAARDQQSPLTRFAQVLRQAADAGTGDAASSSAGASRPSPQEPVGTDGFAVTTTGIPASEMLSEDEQRETRPPGQTFPGDGVPVRDSIAGPRPEAPEGERRGRDKIFDADRFWPMGPRRTDGPAAPRGDHDDAARPGGAPRAPEQDGPPAAPREPSTTELYYGVGSDRYSDRDPNSEETRSEERSVAKTWGVVFAVIVLIIVVLVLLL
ncbi:hypothetical protein [Kocuria tytonis]|uniref:Uncharacterized protein n=1 Tax=Kocuria tytonis TaxID=2054280 RepID=A0A495A5J6_9MICC|nr:hypothetical protein [Kocuria tytonis]RKQ35061.1 hypothetical protein C1C97_007260 [Kocuria tytonis]